MSILKTTNSGIYTPLTKELLIKIGFHESSGMGKDCLYYRDVGEIIDVDYYANAFYYILIRKTNDPTRNIVKKYKVCNLRELEFVIKYWNLLTRRTCIQNLIDTQAEKSSKFISHFDISLYEQLKETQERLKQYEKYLDSNLSIVFIQNAKNGDEIV